MSLKLIKKQMFVQAAVLAGHHCSVDEAIENFIDAEIHLRKVLAERSMDWLLYEIRLEYLLSARITKIFSVLPTRLENSKKNDQLKDTSSFLNCPLSCCVFDDQEDKQEPDNTPEVFCKRMKLCSTPTLDDIERLFARESGCSLCSFKSLDDEPVEVSAEAEEQLSEPE